MEKVNALELLNRLTGVMTASILTHRELFGANNSVEKRLRQLITDKPLVTFTDERISNEWEHWRNRIGDIGITWLLSTTPQLLAVMDDEEYKHLTTLINRTLYPFHPDYIRRDVDLYTLMTPVNSEPKDNQWQPILPLIILKLMSAKDIHEILLTNDE